MKKKIDIFIRILIAIAFIPICQYCGEITDNAFTYGMLWVIIADIVMPFQIRIKIIDKKQK